MLYQSRPSVGPVRYQSRASVRPVQYHLCPSLTRLQYQHRCSTGTAPTQYPYHSTSALPPQCHGSLSRVELWCRCFARAEPVSCQCSSMNGVVPEHSQGQPVSDSRDPTSKRYSGRPSLRTWRRPRAKFPLVPQSFHPPTRFQRDRSAAPEQEQRHARSDPPRAAEWRPSAPGRGVAARARMSADAARRRGKRARCPHEVHRGVPPGGSRGARGAGRRARLWVVVGPVARQRGQRLARLTPDRRRISSENRPQMDPQNDPRSTQTDPGSTPDRPNPKSTNAMGVAAIRRFDPMRLGACGDPVAAPKRSHGAVTPWRWWRSHGDCIDFGDSMSGAAWVAAIPCRRRSG